MIKPNYIQKLLNGVEVEWKTLKEVVEYEQPTKYIVKSKNYCDNFDTPVLTAGKTFILGYTDEIEGIYKASKKPVIIFDDFTTSNKWVDFDFKVKSSAMKMITLVNESETLLKYVYYWINKLPNELSQGDHKRQWISNFSKKLIPIPPIHIQKEIVHILDNFSELIGKLKIELSKEIAARKKQYEYYRNEYLTFDDNEVNWQKLEEIADFRNGKGHERAISQDGKYVVVNSRFISTNGKVRKYSNKQISPLFKNEILIVMSDLPNGKALAKCYLVDEDDKYTLNQRIGALKVKNTNVIGSEFLYFILNRNNQLLKYDNGIDQTNLKKAEILQTLIPIPSMEQQQNIVAIFNHLDRLVDNTVNCLSVEIESRQKQYEYYCNLLLTFPKSEVEV